MTEISNKPESQKREYGVLNLIGIFLSVFGASVLSAIFFSDSIQGKIANLISGLMIIFTATVAFIGAYLMQKRK